MMDKTILAEVEKAASATAEKLSGLLLKHSSGHKGFTDFSRASNMLANEALAPAVGALMPIPMSSTGIAIVGPDDSVHLLLYANVVGDADKISKGFFEVVDSYLMPSILGKPVVTKGAHCEVV